MREENVCKRFYVFVRRSSTTINKFLSAAVVLTCFDNIIIDNRCEGNMSKNIKKYKISKEIQK